jgi:hypothetical protein
LDDKRCQLNRSMQHLLGVYSQEFGILKFFLDTDLTAAPRPITGSKGIVSAVRLRRTDFPLRR